MYDAQLWYCPFQDVFFTLKLYLDGGWAFDQFAIYDEQYMMMLHAECCEISEDIDDYLERKGYLMLGHLPI